MIRSAGHWLTAALTPRCTGSPLQLIFRSSHPSSTHYAEIHHGRIIMRSVHARKTNGDHLFNKFIAIFSPAARRKISIDICRSEDIRADSRNRQAASENGYFVVCANFSRYSCASDVYRRTLFLGGMIDRVNRFNHLTDEWSLLASANPLASRPRGALWDYGGWVIMERLMRLATCNLSYFV